MYNDTAEALIVGLARTGDRDAFNELVLRRQSWIRNLMRRCCGDETLADDLSQQVFLQAWSKIGGLWQADRFGAWLKQLAINTWLQHVRVNQPDIDSWEAAAASEPVKRETGALRLDLDRALALLPPAVRLCIVLSYNEGMSHREIADHAGMPLGTVKSHIRRGTERLQLLLADYAGAAREELQHE